LLNGIQDELDKSWAILGEVYGRFPKLCDLKISLRRIDSNIFNSKVKESFDYIPEKIIFDADPDVLKHLIAPLYGQNPSYGIRELLQNAMDACREHEYIYTSKRVDSYEPYIPQITLNFSENNESFFFTISDNGIGMTKDILLNYFFKAGATFRKSPKWLMMYSDAKGNSNVIRTGRFGVGVLASFLLGNEISVTTRHLNSDKGYSFSAKLNQNQIEIKKVHCNVGTIITVGLNKLTWTTLRNQAQKMSRVGYRNRYRYSEVPSWNQWFVYTYPEVMIITPEDWLIDNEDKIDIHDQSKWHTLSVEDFNKVQWSYDATYRNSYSMVCNGILIPGGYKSSQLYTYGSNREYPSVLITDNNGVLPLTLNRNSVEEDLPFETDLYRDIMLGSIFELLSKVEEKRNDNLYQLYKLNHPLLSYNNNIWGEGRIIYLNKGYCLPHSYFIDKLKIKSLTKVFCNLDEDYIYYPFETNGVTFVNGESLENFSELKNFMYEEEIRIDKIYHSKSRRIYIHTDKYNHLFEENRQRLRYDFKVNVRTEFSNDKWTCIVIGDPEESSIQENELYSFSDVVEVIIEYFDITITKSYPVNKKLKTLDLYSDLLNQYIGDNIIIPYGITERRSLYPQAFNELDIYPLEYL